MFRDDSFTNVHYEITVDMLWVDSAPEEFLAALLVSGWSTPSPGEGENSSLDAICLCWQF